MKPTIKETVVGQVEKTDLDCYVNDQLMGENPDGHDYDWVHAYDRSLYWKENDHIPVEMLQEAIDELKAKGATHIQIEPHCDHYGYYFTGVVLELMPEKDVLEKEKQELETAIMHNEIGLKLEETQLNEKRERIEKQKERLNKL